MIQGISVEEPKEEAKIEETVKPKEESQPQPQPQPEQAIFL